MTVRFVGGVAADVLAYYLAPPRGDFTHSRSARGGRARREMRPLPGAFPRAGEVIRLRLPPGKVAMGMIISGLRAFAGRASRRVQLQGCVCEARNEKGR